MTKKNNSKTFIEALKIAVNFLHFLCQKIFPAKYRHKVALKLYFFVKNGPKLIQAGIKKLFLFIAYQQILVKNRRCFFTVDFKAFFVFFALIVFTLTLATILVFASFCQKSQK
jgi:hypothetical protein